MKNIRALIFLFAANSISGFATGITFLAVPWYLISYMGGENGKFLNTALMGTITFVSLFWGTYAGTLIDKYNRKRIFQASNLTNMVLLLTAAGIGSTLGSMPFPLIAMAAACTIFFYNINFPNIYAFVQEMFEPKYYRKVNSAIEIQHQTTSFLGMMVGGLLISGSGGAPWWPEALAIERWELWEILMLDGITYGISFALISFIKYDRDPNRKIDTGSIIKRVKGGFEYVIQQKNLLIFGICSHVIFFSLLVFTQAMMPVYIHDYLNFDKVSGGIVLAEVEMAYSLGALTVGLLGIVLARFIRKTNSIKQIIFFLFAATGIYLIWAFTSHQWIFILTSLLMGIANGGTRILRITYIIRIVPNHKIGRTNSFFSIINVLMRSGMLAILTMPFFSGQENGGNVVYGVLIFAGITAASGLVLLLRFSSFDHKSALN